ncbi:transposase [Bacillus thuringiensis]|uniref:transposase n=1 Tax=Bacillus thuringiensis TaxID=1428 RepID=UPI003D006DCF
MVTLFSAVNMPKVNLHYMEGATCNAIAFQDFLQYIVKENHKKYIVMVLDNARIDYAKLLKAFLRKIANR